ncbi:interleukin-15 isoform X3 [Pseudorasbora parva]|uniref:interleukin-15 isoform X3 n=1 Tax=Pseudorasbora parva TaxID=51549 RepID=UPI00351E56FE
MVKSAHCACNSRPTNCFGFNAFTPIASLTVAASHQSFFFRCDFQPLVCTCLSALLPMAEGHAMQVLRDLQNALNETEDLFSKSDARLYTPNIDHINVCTNTFFDCFLMEMNVLLHEEDPTNPKMVEIQRTLDHYTSMNIGPRVWRKRGEEHNQRCLRSSVKFTASDGLGCRVIGWCWSTLYSEVQGLGTCTQCQSNQYLVQGPLESLFLIGHHTC